jgi:hypothetical protein
MQGIGLNVLESPRTRKFIASEVAIVSICAYADDQPLKRLSHENHRLYADLHGYHLHQFETKEAIYDNQAANMSTSNKNPFFWKILAVRNVILNYRWVLWMDCDAFFMDPFRTVDSVIASYASPESGSIDAPPAKDLLITVDTTGLNNGVWLMRNSTWSLELLSRWWNSPILQGAGANHNCSDQSTMLHELLYMNAMSNLDNDEGARWDEDNKPIWPSEVAVVPQEDLQSFHRETAEAVLSREYTDGDFIKHHPGCHFYKKPCQEMYERAGTEFKSKLNHRVYLSDHFRPRVEISYSNCMKIPPTQKFPHLGCWNWPPSH